MKNREISFRVWNPNKTKQMDYCGFPCRLFDGDILMQFTGLKDKNGKKIFEGDIILSYPRNEPGDSGHMNGKRKFNVCHSGYTWYLHDGKSDITKGLGIPAWNFNGAINEIIGNIFENPELLK